MNFAELIPLTAAAINLLITIFVVSRGFRATVNRVYMLWGSAITVWNTGTFFMFRVTGAEEALFWARFLQCGVIVLPIALFHLCLLIAQIPRPRLIIGAYVAGALLLASNATTLFVADVRNAGYAYYSVGGPAFWVFTVLYSCLTAATIWMLAHHMQNLSPLHRRRVTSLLWANTTLIVCGTNDILPILGIYHYPWFGWPIFPVGSLAAIFYGLLVGYSTLQHQLLDVRVALGRAAAHFIRFLFLFVIGLVLEILLAVIAGPGQVSPVAFFGSIAVFVVSTVAASMLFPRLIGGRMERLERRLLGDRFEYQDQARSFIESMSWYNDLNALLADLHDLFLRTFRLTSYQIIMRDENTRTFALLRSHPETDHRELPSVTAQSPISRYFEWHKAEYLALNTGYMRPGDSSLERQSREQLRQFQAELCFPLVSENEPFGLILVGSKTNEEPFTATDINLFVTLVKSMSLIVNQIRLKTQVLHAQELDLLGRMSRGMAHDLNNLLTPVWTLLELSNELGNGTLDEELLPVALRNVKTMRAYIREALFFSENLRPDLQRGRLDLVVLSAIQTARTSRKKQIEVIADVPEEVLADIDEVLIQRLFANLVANAIDASPEGEFVEVHLERLPTVDVHREWLRIRIVDHGEGIPKENLSRILTPYFTTKNRGDENRGFGLGLAICRKIVTLHGGNLAISSQIRKGTSVQVDLPSRQPKPAISSLPTAAAS